MADPNALAAFGTNALIHELWERGDLELALQEFKRRQAYRVARADPPSFFSRLLKRLGRKP